MFQFYIRTAQSSLKSFIKHRAKFLHSYTLENIHSYGSLKMNCPLVSINVKCINPHEVPGGDKSFIRLEPTNTGFSLKNFSIEYEKKSSNILIKLKKEYEQLVPSDVFLFVEVPHIYDLDLEALQVNVAETEGDQLIIASEKDCHLGKIKSLNTDITSYGAITCKSLLGDGSINAVGHLSIKRLQSKGIDIKSGTVDISAVYCPNFKFQTSHGGIKIDNLHGCGEISADSGDVTIGTLDGDVEITTNSGQINVTIEQCGVANCSSYDGDIDIGLGDSLSAFIESRGKVVDVPEDLLVDGMKEHSSSGYQSFEGSYGDGKSSIQIKTENGHVTFSKKNWFSRFQLED